jgi:hypothetical protein
MSQLGFRTVEEMVGRTDKLMVSRHVTIGKQSIWIFPPYSTDLILGKSMQQ